jgi:hypothetical protein
MKDATTTPPETEQEVLVATLLGREVTVQWASVGLLVLKPHPLILTGVPGGPDHCDNSMSGRAGVNVVIPVLVSKHGPGTENGMSAFASIGTTP